MSTTEITRLLSSLSKEELRSVLAQINFLLGIDDGSHDEPSKEEYLTEDQALFYNELVKVLRAYHVQNILSHEGTSLKPRLKGFKKEEFEKIYDGVQTFLTNYAPNLDMLKRIRFYSILADTLSCYIIAHGDIIGIRSMMTYLDDVEEVFEYGFPGYLRNNLFSRVLESW